MALTSIIIPTHDRPELLQRAVESARRAGAEIEIVVVDDGSTDETSAVCASLEGIVYVRLEQRRGVGHARAAGMAASSGTYISFLDDDDARLEGSIDRQLAILEAAPDAALVYGQVYSASQSLAIDVQRLFPPLCPSGDIFWILIGSNFIASCSAVVRRSAIESVGGMFSEVMPADDWDLWLRIAERYPVAVLPEPVSIYRQPTLWSKQGSSRFAEGLLSADRRVLERCAKLPRAMANPRAFRRAARRMKRFVCGRLLAETLEAARRGDSYAFVSLRHAVATPAAFVHALLSPRTWRKLTERVGS
ncbi:MAG TPA: glycosyltransferase family 2 protein [Thermoanaerobaculia bacterium]|nr:glycosyltransferase family 2 protein [Thermoanaerobaculia bacterium]